jgi:hypothetical protein
MLTDLLKPREEKEILDDIMELSSVPKFGHLLQFYFNRNPEFYMANDGQYFKDLVKHLNEENLIIDIRTNIKLNQTDRVEDIWSTELWFQYKEKFNIILEVHVKDKLRNFVEQLNQNVKDGNITLFKGKPIEHLILVVRDNKMNIFYTE